MNTIYHVIEVAHTKKGMPVISVLKSFQDGKDKWERFQTGKDKAEGYLKYLEEDTRSRIFEITESMYGKPQENRNG